MTAPLVAPHPPVATAAAVTGIAVFDLDRTLVPGSSLAVLGRALVQAGLVTRRQLARHLPREAVFAARGLGPAELERLAQMLLGQLAGREAGPMRAVADEVAVGVAARTYSGARWLLERHQALGHRCVLLSASPHDLVTGVARALGADDGIGTALEVVEGRCTGRLDGPFCHGAGKLQRLRQVVGPQLDRLPVTAYADAASDIDLLEAVEHPVVVNPDRRLRAIAIERCWPVLFLT